MGSLPNSNLLKYRNQHLFKSDIQFDYKKVSVGFSTRYYSFMKNIDKRFEQSILAEYNTSSLNFDDPAFYILPGLKEYRQKNNKGDWIHDFRISYQITPILKTSLIINNFLNAEYTLRPGDVRPPRMFMFQVMLKI